MVNNISTTTVSSVLEAASRNGTLNDHEMNALSIVCILTSSLSFLGSGSVFICSVYHGRVCYPEVFPTFHLSVADMLSSFFLLLSTSLFLTSEPTSPGNPGPCGYIMPLVIGCYTSAFLLTITYALEALFRFQRRLREGIHVDTLAGKTVSNHWMYLAYISAWLIPLGLAIVLMVVTHSLHDDDDQTRLIPNDNQCSSCFPVFTFSSPYCWTGVESGKKWHRMIRLIFLTPLLMVMIINLILYILITRVFKQVAMRRGLLSYHQRQEENLLRRKAILYQSVFFICWIPSVVLGISSFTDAFSMPGFFWLLIIQVILGPLQGICNSVLYGWKRDGFRRALSERTSLLSTNRAAAIFSNCFPCLKKMNSNSTEELAKADI